MCPVNPPRGGRRISSGWSARIGTSREAKLRSFVDLAPTLLSLAGVQPPEWMLLEMAQRATTRDAGAVDELRAGLRDADSGVRYWAAQGLLIRGGAGVTAAADELQAALKDESPTVRIIAARTLGQYGGPADLKAALAVLEELASPQKNGAYASMLALNAIDALGDKAAPLQAMLKDLPQQDRAAPGRVNGYVSRLLEKIAGVKPAKPAAKPKRAKAKKAA